MAGNDHIPTAPKDVIGDDGDLRQMRDALRAGKHVTLASDGHVYVGAEAGTPMTDADETWIESKLGHVIEMARAGYGVSVTPDGSITADRADHLAKARFDNDPGFNEQDVILMKTGVRDGALVRLHTDGHVEYFLPKDAVKPSAANAAQLEAAIDDEISSGRLDQAWKNGETLAAQPDGSLVYQQSVDPGPAPVEFPEDNSPGMPLTTADQLDEEAKGLELGAGAARRITAEEYEASTSDAVKQRDAAARQHAAADAAAAAADAQFAEKQTVAQRIDTERAEVFQRASELRDAGDAIGAEEQAEKWGRLNIEHRIATQEVADAKAAATASRAEAATHSQNEQKFDGQVRESWTSRAKNEDAQDGQEDQARVYRQAATEMREAERLDAAYADLKSRDVSGAERVQEAAAQARARAEELRTKAEDFDKQPVAAPGSDDAPLPKEIRINPGPFGDDLSGVDGEPTSGANTTSVAAAADGGVAGANQLGDDGEIEMAGMDFSGTSAAGEGVDAEIGLPTADFSNGSSVASASTEIEMPVMDLSGGADESGGEFDVATPAPDSFADAGGMQDMQPFEDSSSGSFTEPEPIDEFGGGFDDGAIDA